MQPAPESPAEDPGLGEEESWLVEGGGVGDENKYVFAIQSQAPIPLQKKTVNPFWSEIKNYVKDKLK